MGDSAAFPRSHFAQVRFATPARSVLYSDVLPLHLKVFGRTYRQHVDFSQVAEAPRKVRGRGFSFMYSRKLRGRATIQSRKQEIVVFLHARKRKRASISFLNPQKRRGSDSLFKPLGEGTFHATEAPRKPSRKIFDISLRPQLGLEHCSHVFCLACEQSTNLSIQLPSGTPFFARWEGIPLNIKQAKKRGAIVFPWPRL